MLTAVYTCVNGECTDTLKSKKMILGDTTSPKCHSNIKLYLNNVVITTLSIFSEHILKNKYNTLLLTFTAILSF